MSRPGPVSPDLKLQGRRLVRALNRLFPEPACALDHRNPFELLAATVLSAQCTDARVNLVTPALFARFPGPESLAVADLADVETLIHATGFFRAKARNLVAMAEALVEHHGSQVPRDLEALTALPGVGRKTANVVLGTAFGIASGVVVDTHVKRLTYRLGLTISTNPIVIERELINILPKTQWIGFSHRLILHGRQTCVALHPRCDACALASICPRIGVSGS
ncbi:MAG: endonuclease III [Isosphaeraceae bacterium]